MNAVTHPNVVVADGRQTSSPGSVVVAALPALILIGWRPPLPAWAFMWVLAGAIYVGCKYLCLMTVWTGRLTPRLTAYLLLWPGLDPGPFCGPQLADKPLLRAWGAAAAKVATGLLLLFWGTSTAHVDTYIVGWIAMIALGLILHCGVFHLLALCWQSRGVPVRPLMNSPLLARSLADFWSRRWNVAFRDFANLVIVSRIRSRSTLWQSFVVFLVSGMLHELAISVPARAGYGLPALYFIIQWAGMCGERRWRRQGWGYSTGRHRLLVYVVVLGPAGLLFHDPFVSTVIVPFCTAIGALP